MPAVGPTVCILSRIRRNEAAGNNLYMRRCVDLQADANVRDRHLFLELGQLLRH